MPYKVRDLFVDALGEIGEYDPVEQLDGDDLDTCQRVLTRLVDTMQADGFFVFASRSVPFVLTPNQATNTIGPGGQFDTTATLGASAPRPSWIGVSTVRPAGDVLDSQLIPYKSRDDYSLEPFKGQTDLYPRRFLYDTDWPFGKFTWWPVPTTAATVNLVLPVSPTLAIAPDTVISFPPGNLEVWLYELAKRLCIPYRTKASAEMLDALRTARGLARRNNDPGPPDARGAAATGAGRYDIYTNRTTGQA